VIITHSSLVTLPAFKCCITPGMADMVLADGVTVASKLGKGDMVGQVAMMEGANHEFSVRASVYTEVLCLDKEVGCARGRHSHGKTTAVPVLVFVLEMYHRLLMIL
jgi:hypothetical protein